MIPGTGKSSLLRNLTNHIFERNLYKNGVLYFNLNKCHNAYNAFEILIRYLNSFRKNLIKSNRNAKTGGRNNYGYE
jgi:Cdc6-like AAA superfamily ATPase